MPKNETDELVSDATEATDEQSGESSSIDTQNQSDETPVVEKPDYKRLLKEDPDLRAVFDSEIQRAISKRERAALRAAARQAAESSDAESALEITRRVAQEQDDDDANDPVWSEKADRVQPHLERLLRLDASGMSHNEDYVALHKQVGKAEMDRRYADDPAAFLDWVEDQISDLRLERKLKKVAPTLAEAMATDQVNRQLQRVGAPLTGGAGSGTALTLEAYESMGFEQRQKLRKDNPKLIDAMVARYSSR